jgi:hypothetical protein
MSPFHVRKNEDVSDRYKKAESRRTGPPTGAGSDALPVGGGSVRRFLGHFFAEDSGRDAARTYGHPGAGPERRRASSGGAHRADLRQPAPGRLSADAAKAARPYAPTHRGSPLGPRPAGGAGRAAAAGHDPAVLRRDDRHQGRRNARGLGDDGRAGLAASAGLPRRPAPREGQMTPERWRRIGELLEAAVRIDPAGREAWLRAACGGDNELRTEVGRLVAQHERVHGSAFLTPPGRRARPRIGRRAGPPVSKPPRNRRSLPVRPGTPRPTRAPA